MAKSSKKSKEETAQEGTSTTPGMVSSKTLANSEPVKPAGEKRGAAKSSKRVRSGGKNRSAAPRKPSAERKTRTKPVRQTKAARDAAVTDEEVRVRAYLISEWRMQNGVAGDSARDWLEARRQLQEESGRRV